jgi:glycosyltransferase involved in cell wall biosynthesis
MKISVAIVTRNREADLKECIESILEQIRMPDQILIIDNASTDNTYKIVHELNVPSIKYVMCPDLGISHARNAALDSTNGDIICFLDDDSIAKKDWLYQIESFFEENTDVSAIQGYVGNYYPNHVPALLTQFQRNLNESISIIDGRVERTTFCAAGNLTFRKELLTRNNIRFDVRLKAGEEQDVCKRLKDFGGEIMYLPTAVVYHKWRKNSIIFLKRIFMSGISQSRQFRITNNRKMEEYSSNHSKKYIWMQSVEHSMKLTFPKRISFLSLLLLSNMVKRIGILYGKYL